MISFRQKYIQLLITAVCLLLVVVSSCEDSSTNSTTDDEKLEGAHVVIDPAEASFEYTDQLDFSAYVISASGDTVNDDFELNWEWHSSDPNVFTVQSNGAAKGQHPGEAYCIVEASTESNKIAAKLRFTGRDSAFVRIF